VRVHVGSNEMVTLRSKDALYEPTDAVVGTQRLSRAAAFLRCRALPGAARIDFALSAAVGADGAAVRLSIHRLDGALVTRLFDGRMAAGEHTIVWDYCANGRRVPAGLYVIRMTAGRGSAYHAKLVAR